MRVPLAAIVAGAAAMCSSAILSTAVWAQDRADPTFASGQSLLSEGNSPFTVAVDPDGKAATIYFAGLVNELDGVGAPLFAARTFSVAIPLTGTKRGTKLRLAIGGYVARIREADMSLMTIVNGQPHVLDFAKVTSAPGATITTDDCSKFGSPAKRVATKGKSDPKESALGSKPDIARKPSSGTSGLANDSGYLQCILFDASSTSLRLDIVLVLHRQTRTRTATSAWTP
jgi:hypothetical protein